VTDIADLPLRDLQQYAADHAALAARASAELRTRMLARRVALADFIREHRDTFLEFFDLGGCKRPEEAVDSLIDHPEQYRPMGYAQRDDL